MRLRHLAVTCTLLSVTLVSCGREGPTAPEAMTTRVVTLGGAEAALTAPPVRISEIHYDNTGTDAGEAIEISGPAGTSVAGWTIVLYNGATGASYTPLVTLSGTIPATCGARGVIVSTYPVNGIQNGAPDGIALVDASANVIEFLSYEGTFTATNGPAAGVLSTDIGVSQSGSGAIGLSLQRNADNTWNAEAANTFGACNDDGEVEPPGEAASVEIAPAAATIFVGGTVALTATARDASDVVISGEEFTWTSADPAFATVDAAGVVTGVAEGVARIIATAGSATVADTADITVEVVVEPPSGPVFISEINYDPTGTDVGEAIEVEGPAGLSLAGWQIVLYNGNGGVVYDTDALTGTIPNLCDGRGVVVLTYPSNGIQNGSPDGIALVNNGTVVEFLSYEGPMTAVGGPADGLTAVDIGVSQTNSPTGQTLQRAPSGPWYGPSAGSLGACNGEAPPPVTGISIFGRSFTDPALPVGYQDQLFANYLVDGVVTPTTITWTSETPAIATIDARGVMTGVTPGTAVLRATATDGTTNTISLDVAIATQSPTAVYAGNTEFGEPTDGDPSDDFIIHYNEFTSSFNGVKGIPNWVSYAIEASHFGSQDRCECFTYDESLPASFTRYNTADYTGSADSAGFAISRGHLARSFDRTAGTLDNAHTFLLTNIFPQASNMNSGPWALFENFLGAFAQSGTKEVYVVTGTAGSQGTVLNAGIITIPAAAWKVAVVVDRDVRLADITSESQMQVYAVIMPNLPTATGAWEPYAVTVDAVEALSGYDVLALMRDDIETLVESGTHRPVAATDGPYTGREGDPIAMSAAGSSDADGGPLSITWHFGDGHTAVGANVSHTYAQDGTYAVMAIATDPLGVADTAHTTAAVDPFVPAEGIEEAIGMIEALVADGTLNSGNGNALLAKLNAAASAVANGNANAARGQLGALRNQIAAFVSSGKLTAAQGAALDAFVVRILAALG